MATRLNMHFAIRKTLSGNWLIYQYDPKSKSLDALPDGNRIVFDVSAMMEIAGVICEETGGCDLLGDVRSDLVKAKNRQIDERCDSLIAEMLAGIARQCGKFQYWNALSRTRGLMGVLMKKFDAALNAGLEKRR